VVNGDLQTPLLFGWQIEGNVTEDEGMSDYIDFYSKGIKMTNTIEMQSYTTQKVLIQQTHPEPLYISAWSKAKAVSGQRDYNYALFLDIESIDGDYYWGFSLPFDVGTHDWQLQWKVFRFEKPIQTIRLYMMFKHTGTVWFDNVYITSLTSEFCQIKFSSIFLTPAITDPSLSLATKNNDKKNKNDNALDNKNTNLVDNTNKFILVWTTPKHKFTLRHRKVLESIFYHHPDAVVQVFSNSLPFDMFYKFNQAGYNIRVFRYNISELCKGLPGEAWVKQLDTWSQSQHFYAHLADYLRFVLLYRYGGIYSDFDSILVKPLKSPFQGGSSDKIENEFHDPNYRHKRLHATNIVSQRTQSAATTRSTTKTRVSDLSVIGAEYCDSLELSWCTQLLDFRKPEDRGRKTAFYVAIGFMAFTRQNHPFLHQILTYFDTIYNPLIWPCGTQYASLAYLDNPSSVQVVAPVTFYPISWQDIQQYFESDDAAMMNTIESYSQAVHLWGKMTSSVKIVKSSLIWNILMKYSLSNIDPEREADLIEPNI